MRANNPENEETPEAKQAAQPVALRPYLNCLLAYKGLPASIAPLLEEFLKYPVSIAGQQGGQLLFLNMALKQQIAESTGKTVKRIEQVITKLVKSGVLVRVTPATYQLNGEYFGPGPMKNLAELKMEINFKTDVFKATFR
jgi:hypothetical protein